MHPAGFAAMSRRALARLPRLPGRGEHVALGSFCHVTTALRDAGLRRWTGPFDWIFSTPAMVAACLDDDFAELTHPAKLVSVPAEMRPAWAAGQSRHPAFEARYGLPVVFNHHDPAANPADAAALRRAIDRLRRTLAGHGRAAFYTMGHDPWPAAEIDALCAALGRRRGGQGRTTLAVITVVFDPVSIGWRITGDTLRHGCRCIAVDIHAGSRSHGIFFPDPLDEGSLGAAVRGLARLGRRPIGSGEGRLVRRAASLLPADFDPATYLALHADVAAAGVEPGLHYHAYGRQEGRAYR